MAGCSGAHRHAEGRTGRRTQHAARGRRQAARGRRPAGQPGRGACGYHGTSVATQRHSSIGLPQSPCPTERLPRHLPMPLSIEAAAFNLAAGRTPNENFAAVEHAAACSGPWGSAAAPFQCMRAPRRCWYRRARPTPRQADGMTRCAAPEARRDVQGAGGCARQALSLPVPTGPARSAVSSRLHPLPPLGLGRAGRGQERQQRPHGLGLL